MWGAPDWADRPEGDDPAAWPRCERHQPGTRFKYDDVRISVLAYSLLQVLREPLPVVLKRDIIDPIDAAPTWRVHGYENSWVELGGRRLQSATGSGQFDGGLFISTRDHARFGLLMGRRGVWSDRRLLPDDWFEVIQRPVPVRTDYGLLWWPNAGRERIPSAPASAYRAAAFGSIQVYIDECNDLVVVLRWIAALEDVVERVVGAMKNPRLSCPAS